jgi:hypothetical protein
MGVVAQGIGLHDDVHDAIWLLNQVQELRHARHSVHVAKRCHLTMGLVNTAKAAQRLCDAELGPV